MHVNPENSPYPGADRAGGFARLVDLGILAAPSRESGIAHFSQ